MVVDDTVMVDEKWWYPWLKNGDGGVGGWKRQRSKKRYKCAYDSE